jgi:hypothetical protein
MIMKIKKGYKLKNIAGECVLVVQGHAGIDATKIIVFNPTAEWLWKNLSDREFTAEDVTGLITAQYGIDTAQAEADASAWITRLSDCNILEA